MDKSSKSRFSIGKWFLLLLILVFFGMGTYLFVPICPSQPDLIVIDPDLNSSEWTISVQQDSTVKFSQQKPLYIRDPKQIEQIMNAMGHYRRLEKTLFAIKSWFVKPEVYIVKSGALPYLPQKFSLLGYRSEVLIWKISAYHESKKSYWTEWAGMTNDASLYSLINTLYPPESWPRHTK